MTTIYTTVENQSDEFIRLFDIFDAEIRQSPAVKFKDICFNSFENIDNLYLIDAPRFRKYLKKFNNGIDLYEAYVTKFSKEDAANARDCLDLLAYLTTKNNIEQYYTGDANLSSFKHLHIIEQDRFEKQLMNLSKILYK